MKVIIKLFRFYIHSSIHLSLAVVALVVLTFLYFQIPLDYHLLVFVFFGSISGYNFIKYFEIAHWKNKTLKKSLRVIRLLTVIASLLAFYFFVFLDITLQIWIFICGAITVLYALPIFPQNKNLRTFNGLKIFIIAAICTVVTALLPLLKGGYELPIFWILLQRFVFILVVLLPFEIRDVDRDALSLGTLPQKIGVTKTKWTGIFLLLGFMILSFIIYPDNQSHLISDLLAALLAAAFLVFSTKAQGKYYASFWVEAVPLFWLFLFWVLGIL